MNILLNTVVFFLLMIVGGKCNPPVPNPVAYFAKLMSVVNRTVYEWDVDINNDGKVDVLLDTKPNAHDIEMRGNDYDANSVRLFTTYLWINGQYVMSPCNQQGIGQIGEIASVKLDECHVGTISEISNYGIVSIERTDERASRGVGATITMARIYAYVVRDNIVKKVKLAEFDSDDDNTIYNKYLAPSKRTTVVLKEITVSAP